MNARYLVQHKSSGETFAAEIDRDGMIHATRVLHWSDWQQPDSTALRTDIDLFDVDLDRDFEPYPDSDWRYVAGQDAPGEPLRNVR